MDEVHGIISISFAGVSTCLPTLFPLHIRNPRSERESFQTRNLGSYKKRFKPALLPAFRAQQGGKEKKGKKKSMGAPPPNPPGK